MNEENKQPQNIFEAIETKEKPSERTKTEVVGTLQSIQNTSHVVDFFVDKYFKTLTQVISK